MAAVIALSLHAFLLGSILYGTAASYRPAAAGRSGPGARAVASSAEPVMTMILVDVAGEADRDQAGDELAASRSPAAEDLAVTIASPDSLPAIDLRIDESPESASPASDPSLDPATRTLLYGRYLTQIQARIERAWMRPRSPVTGGLFRCRVQILQDRVGTVQETTLQSCNGDARWQQSLVNAIQSASPLPVPPDPRVFANAVMLEFTSLTYRPWEISEGFEPPRIAAAGASKPAPAAFDRERTLPSEAKSPTVVPDVIELRIIGRPAPMPQTMPVSIPVGTP